MIIVKVSNTLIEKLLKKNNKMPKCELVEGLPKDAKLVEVKWDHYKTYVELCFETEESRNKVVELLPKISVNKE